MSARALSLLCGALRADRAPWLPERRVDLLMYSIAHVRGSGIVGTAMRPTPGYLGSDEWRSLPIDSIFTMLEHEGANPQRRIQNP